MDNSAEIFAIVLCLIGLIIGALMLRNKAIDSTKRIVAIVIIIVCVLAIWFAGERIKSKQEKELDDFRKAFQQS